MLARLRGVKVRIAHSHNTTCGHMKIHRLLTPIFNRTYNYGIACGYDAGKWLFNNRNFYVLPNSFETEKYCYNENARDEVRREIGVNDELVVGHVGRFNDQKNHRFILQLFEKIAGDNPTSVLLLVGDKELKIAIYCVY